VGVNKEERESIKVAKSHDVRSVKLLLTNESLADYLLGPEVGSMSLALERGIFGLLLL
jgi:hypothetical protein